MSAVAGLLFMAAVFFFLGLIHRPLRMMKEGVAGERRPGVINYWIAATCYVGAGGCSVAAVVVLILGLLR